MPIAPPPAAAAPAPGGGGGGGGSKSYIPIFIGLNVVLVAVLGVVLYLVLK